MRRICRAPLFPALCLLLVLTPFARGQQPPPASAPAPAPPPADSEMEEKVTVRLAEVQILVTDRDGNPITDLKPGEVEVRENGEPRKLAYLEPFSTAGSLAKTSPQPTPLAAPGGKPTTPEAAVAIPSPPPQRWIVLLFDVLNSRTMDRKHWVAAARNWVAKDMRPEDRVAVMTLQSEGEIRELVPFSGDQDLLSHALAEDELLDGYPHRDFANDMRQMVDDLNETCAKAHSPESCSSGLSEPFVNEWKVRGDQTLHGLQRLAGSLGAIPGRKVILFMSPGVVLDPRMTAGNAALSVFGTDKLSAAWAMGKHDADLHQQMLQMTRVAAAADVSFFGFDTRPASLRDASSSAEQSVIVHERRLFDPFQQIFDSTRGSLDTIAIRTGGRTLHGTDIGKNLPVLARAIEGIYSIGFYRDPEAGRTPTVKVKVLRRGTTVTYQDRYDSRRSEPTTIPVEVAIGQTQGLAGGILVPVIAQARASSLTFKEEEVGQDVARLSLYAEAITPEGRREFSAFQQVEVRVDVSRRSDRAKLSVSHELPLLLPPGAYRIRVRLSEVSFEHASDRTVDITVNSDGTVTPGIQISGRIQQTGQLAVPAPGKEGPSEAPK